jgi:hypothetical protein
MDTISSNLFLYGSTALYGPGPPRFVEASRSHTLDTPHSIGLLWTRDQLVAQTTHNTHNRQTSIPPLGFEPTILVSERPKTHALDRTATGIGISSDQLPELSVITEISLSRNSMGNCE